MPRLALSDDELDRIADAVFERVLARVLGWRARDQLEQERVDQLLEGVDLPYVEARIASALERVKGRSNRQRPLPATRTWRTPTAAEVAHIRRLDVARFVSSARSADREELLRLEAQGKVASRRYQQLRAQREQDRALHLTLEEASSQFDREASEEQRRFDNLRPR
jgi:hypothetical protein